MTARISFVFRIIIGVIFLSAGLAKISDPVRFLLTIREFQLFPETIVPFITVAVPWLEFFPGLCLITGVLFRAASLLIAALNIVFAAALASVILRGIEIDCGCFGLLADILKLPDAADITAVVRDIVFTGMCLYIYRAQQTMYSLEKYLWEQYGYKSEEQITRVP